MTGGSVSVLLAIPPSSGPPRYHADKGLPGLGPLLGFSCEVPKPPSAVPAWFEGAVTKVASFPTSESSLFVNIIVFPLSPEPPQVS